MTHESSSNKACVLMKAMTIEIKDVPIPPVNKDDVKVKLEATGICGTDMHIYRHFGVGREIMTDPVVLGHESVGTVVQVGENVKDVSVGDRVAIEPFFSCRKCFNCKRGKTNLCKTFRQAGFMEVQGTLSQYYVCESDFLVKVPDSVSWEEGGCIQPLAVAIQIAKRAKFGAGQTLAVFGCGPLGCLIMAVARAYGVSKILAFDISQKRVDFAKSLWADYAALSPVRPGDQDILEWADAFKMQSMADAGLESWGVDIAVEASGAEACMAAGMSFVHPGGTYVQAGLGRPLNTFPTSMIVVKELDVIGSVRYTVGCFQTAIELIASGKINLKPMITAVFPLSKSVEALECVMQERT
ncbi:GroES-like protein [Hymenopellis radicata]|nr:GroES-like protein [Hymenopellis radicata]